LQTIFLLAVFFTHYSWASSDDEDYASASGDSSQPWSESKGSGIQPPSDNKGLGMYTSYTGTFKSGKFVSQNISILSDISFFCTYTVVAAKTAHWRPWQMQQVCKESMDGATCEQVYIMPVELNKFSRRWI